MRAGGAGGMDGIANARSHYGYCFDFEGLKVSIRKYSRYVLMVFSKFFKQLFFMFLYNYNLSNASI